MFYLGPYLWIHRCVNNLNFTVFSFILMTDLTKLCTEHPPRATPRAFELLKIGLFKFPPLGARKPFKCPTN